MPPRATSRQTGSGAFGGIVNGTTNYILTAMAQEGQPTATCLIDAQDLGYAEADPTGDVEGHDAVNKFVILARLGVRRVARARFDRVCAADGLGHGPAGDHRRDRSGGRGGRRAWPSIKLLATAARTDAGIVASVLPTAVPADSPFGWTDGVTNRIEIDAEPLGTVRLAGPGAGAPRRAARCSATCWPWRAWTALDVGGPAAGRGTLPSPRSMGARCRSPLVRLRAAGPGRPAARGPRGSGFGCRSRRGPYCARKP